MLCQVEDTSPQRPPTAEFHYVKYPEVANPKRQKVDWGRPDAMGGSFGGTWGLTANAYGASFGVIQMFWNEKVEMDV